MFYLLEQYFDILNFVQAIVIHRVAIGDKLAGMIPVANRQGGYPKQSGDIVYG